ncbi:MAG: FAD-dependent oxidoreductase [Kofleriaceae bacterium]
MTAPAASYDLVVVGGGIVGAGVARDAALRGLRVAVFEKTDWGAGTSSKSSKLIHGGLRYLEHGEIRLVFESVSERRVQTKVAPHLVRPLQFLVPIYQDNRPGLEVMNLGLWIYDSLAMFRSPGLHRTLRGKRAATEVEPQLRPEGPARRHRVLRLRHRRRPAGARERARRPGAGRGVPQPRHRHPPHP